MKPGGVSKEAGSTRRRHVVTLRRPGARLCRRPTAALGSFPTFKLPALFPGGAGHHRQPVVRPPGLSAAPVLADRPPEALEQPHGVGFGVEVRVTLARGKAHRGAASRIAQQFIERPRKRRRGSLVHTETGFARPQPFVHGASAERHDGLRIGECFRADEPEGFGPGSPAADVPPRSGRSLCARAVARGTGFRAPAPKWLPGVINRSINAFLPPTAT
jgi:hypothetical protein